MSFNFFGEYVNISTISFKRKLGLVSLITLSFVADLLPVWGMDEPFELKILRQRAPQKQIQSDFDVEHYNNATIFLSPDKDQKGRMAFLDTTDIQHLPTISRLASLLAKIRLEFVEQEKQLQLAAKYFRERQFAKAEEIYAKIIDNKEAKPQHKLHAQFDLGQIKWERAKVTENKKLKTSLFIESKNLFQAILEAPDEKYSEIEIQSAVFMIELNKKVGDYKAARKFCQDIIDGKYNASSQYLATAFYHKGLLDYRGQGTSNDKPDYKGAAEAFTKVSEIPEALPEMSQQATKALANIQSRQETTTKLEQHIRQHTDGVSTRKIQRKVKAIQTSQDKKDAKKEQKEKSILVTQGFPKGRTAGPALVPSANVTITKPQPSTDDANDSIEKPTLRPSIETQTAPDTLKLGSNVTKIESEEPTAPSSQITPQPANQEAVDPCKELEQLAKTRYLPSPAYEKLKNSGKQTRYKAIIGKKYAIAEGETDNIAQKASAQKLLDILNTKQDALKRNTEKPKVNKTPTTETLHDPKIPPESPTVKAPSRTYDPLEGVSQSLQFALAGNAALTKREKSSQALPHNSASNLSVTTKQLASPPGNEGMSRILLPVDEKRAVTNNKANQSAPINDQTNLTRHASQAATSLTNSLTNTQNPVSKPAGIASGVRSKSSQQNVLLLKSTQQRQTPQPKGEANKGKSESDQNKSSRTSTPLSEATSRLLPSKSEKNRTPIPIPQGGSIAPNKPVRNDEVIIEKNPSKNALISNTPKNQEKLKQQQKGGNPHQKQTQRGKKLNDDATERKSKESNFLKGLGKTAETLEKTAKKIVSHSTQAIKQISHLPNASEQTQNVAQQFYLSSRYGPESLPNCSWGPVSSHFVLPENQLRQITPEGHTLIPLPNRNNIPPSLYWHPVHIMKDPFPPLQTLQAKPNFSKNMARVSSMFENVTAMFSQNKTLKEPNKILLEKFKKVNEKNKYLEKYKISQEKLLESNQEPPQRKRSTSESTAFYSEKEHKILSKEIGEKRPRSLSAESHFSLPLQNSVLLYHVPQKVEQ